MEVVIENKVVENTTHEELKDVELLENLDLPKDILVALKKRGVKSISELASMTDVYPRIVGVDKYLEGSRISQNNCFQKK